MAQTSISIKSTERSGGKVANKSITFVNNEAENADLAALGEALCDLTTNNYVETNRVDKSNCDTEQGGGGGDTGLLDPQLTVTKVDTKIYNVSRLGTGAVNIAAGLDSVYGGGTSCAISPETLDGGVLQYDITGAECGGEPVSDNIAVFLASDGTYATAWAFA